jgi:hypothetical protein
MSWTYVNSGGTNNSASSGNTTLSWSPTIGNVLYAATANFSANITSIGDGHNTWSRVASKDVILGGTYLDLWSAPVTTGGALTITATGQSSGALGILEVTPSGTVTADGSAVTNSASASETLSTGSITITGGDLVMGVFSSATTPFASWTPGSGYTAAFSYPYTSGVSVALLFEYALNVSGPTANPGASTLSNNNMTAIGAAFLAVGGGGGATAYPASLLPAM